MVNTIENPLVITYIHPSTGRCDTITLGSNITENDVDYIKKTANFLIPEGIHYNVLRMSEIQQSVLPPMDHKTQTSEEEKVSPFYKYLNKL